MTSKISWCDEVWETTAGCTKISEGCRNCFAARLAATRLKHHPDCAGLAVVSHERTFGEGSDSPHAFVCGVRATYDWTGEVRLLPHNLNKPFHWRKPRRVFVNSRSDLFHESVPFEYIARVWDAFFDCEQHTFLVLTKRAQRLKEFAEWMNRSECRRIDYPNVHLGVTAENQEQADKRIPLLLQTPAAVRFVSVEPMLGPVDINEYIGGINAITERRGFGLQGRGDGGAGDRLGGPYLEDRVPSRESVDGRNSRSALRTPPSREDVGQIHAGASDDRKSPGQRLSSQIDLETLPRTDTSRTDHQSQERCCDGQSSGKPGTGDILRTDQALDPCARAPHQEEHAGSICWVICGCESGPGARPMELDWARSLRDQCQAANVPYYLKQIMEGGKLVHAPMLDGRTWEELP